MASAWGGSWGRAWGNAWGRISSSVQPAIVPGGWLGEHFQRRRRPTDEEVRDQRIRLGIIEPETVAVAVRKRQEPQGTARYWELHAYEQLLLQEAEQLRRLLDTFDQWQKEQHAEAQRLAEIAVQKARQREKDIAFVLAMMM